MNVDFDLKLSSRKILYHYLGVWNNIIDFKIYSSMKKILLKSCRIIISTVYIMCVQCCIWIRFNQTHIRFQNIVIPLGTIQSCYIRANIIFSAFIIFNHSSNHQQEMFERLFIIVYKNNIIYCRYCWLAKYTFKIKKIVLDRIIDVWSFVHG